MERLLYNTKYDSKARTVPMRVLCVGLSRSGTDSLRQALEILGVRNPEHGFTIASTPGSLQRWTTLGMKKYHARSPSESKVTRAEFDEVLGDCEAITDFTAAVHAADLVEAYPEAKVVLNVRRDLHAWYQSVNSTIGTYKSSWLPFGILPFFNAELYWRSKFFSQIWDRFFFDDFHATATWRYEEHGNMVRGMVAPERLLEWSVEDGWEPLCKFLDVEIPQEPFPSGNMPKAFFETVTTYRARQTRAACRNLVICVVLVGMTGWYGFQHGESWYHMSKALLNI